ncbi:hypothetical protein BSKO_07087 [Bryopsis sp. KO-2023]|nr:hypothetical protein BSKO_07087 [Bryopsis sp. KO-2023]
MELFTSHSVVEAIFRQIESAPNPKPELTDDQLYCLEAILAGNFERSLELIDKGKIQCYVGKESGRRIFQVKGKSASYTVFPKHYCSCQSYFYSVFVRSDSTYCKHQLATRLADALGICPTSIVDDFTLARMLLQE